MTDIYEELREFLESNQNDETRIREYYSSIIIKLDNTNKKVDRIAIYLFLIILLYYLFGDLKAVALQAGPLQIQDLTIIKKLTPAIFSFTFFMYAFLGRVSGQLTLTAKFLFAYINNQEIKGEELDDSLTTNNISRMALPYSFWAELTEVMGKVGVLGYIFYIPILLVTILMPFVFFFSISKTAYSNYSDGITWISVVLGLWFFCMALYFLWATFIKYKWKGFKEVAD